MSEDGRMEDPFRIEFNDEGNLVIEGRDGWGEAICPECEQPIRWVLDMMSFTTGFAGKGHRLAHARCVWTAEAFEVQGRLATD